VICYAGRRTASRPRGARSALHCGAGIRFDHVVEQDETVTVLRMISLPVVIAAHARRHGCRTCDVAARERIREGGG
jgi:hypothetical protein